ncbi:MAG: DUF885 family protein [Candidatus Aminicenantales bacterium]
MRNKFLVIAGLSLWLVMAASAQVDVQQRGQRGGAGAQATQQPPAVPANLNALLTPKQSEMRIVTQRYEADRAELSRFYHVLSANRFSRLKRFDMDWAAALDELKADNLSAAAKSDLRTLKNNVIVNLKRLDTDAASSAQLGPLIPFAAGIAQLEEARLRMDSMNPEKAAIVVSKVSEQIGRARAILEEGLGEKAKLEAMNLSKDLVVRGADSVNGLRTTLRDWFNFTNEFDPLFTWWMAQPYKDADKALLDYGTYLREKVAPAVKEGSAPAAPPSDISAAPTPKFAEVPDLQSLIALPQDEMRGVAQQFRGSRGGRGGNRGGSGSIAAPDKRYFIDWLSALKKLNFAKLSRDGQIDYLYLRNSLEVQIRRLNRPPQADIPRKTDTSGINGQPIGRDALMLNLAEEMIPYTPEQLIELANQQFAWCESEMKKASRELGFGDEWKQAIEKIKDMHAPPGKQPDVVRDLMWQAVDFLRAHELITIPEIEWETLRMEMMSPQRQLVNPFFTGGALISVSFPANTMTTQQKLESMRGNNIPFSHATAFHEMIPGHNMQSFMSPRYGVNRGNLANTAFWTEGWPVYWETLLYDMGFDATPEERIGALFWRMHRCARIVFSLKFHLGEWSPQECIDYLVDKVGHERENATAEVRRSFGGGYGPLYQAAYLIGALQMRELRREIVDSGQMTIKQFHDAVIQMGNIPIALLRLELGKQKLAPGMSLDWKFYDFEARTN